VPHFLTDLADLQVRTEEFVETVLDTAAQPIWVVDANDVIRFANPAAVGTLGYDDAEELLGRRSHETIHYRHPDGTRFPAVDCPMRLPRVTGETVARELDWFIRRDGSMFPVSYVAAPIGMPAGRGAVVAFTDIEDRLRAEQVLRERDAELATREGALRRIASLVAGGAASSEVFAAIAREVGRVTGLPMVALWRYEGDTTATVIGAWSEHPHPFQAGTRWPLDGPTICAKVLKTGLPTRIDDFTKVPGTIAEAARGTRIRACAGAPIIVDGAVWGAMSADAIEPAPLPDGIEARLAGFTELVATAVASSTSREQLAALADEQAALRRVATLVAHQAAPAEIFAAVADEVARLLRVEDTTIFRYEDDGTATAVADRGDRPVPLAIGSRMPLDGDSATALVRRTGRPARIDDFSDATGPLADYTRIAGIGSTVGSPIVVDGRLWGAMIAATRSDARMPPSTESRMGQFTELVATAISNVQARSDLAASRARIAAAADEERRRVVQDLHDGAQQRLVHTVLTLKLASRAFDDDDRARALVTEALEQAESAIAELRELAHGILPRALSHGGLRAGAETLASRMPVPIECDVSVDQLPPAIEATAYFVLAESLTNVAKHARASRVTVAARVEDGMLTIRVRDDGVGGARPNGPGLLGLADRLAVLGGRLRVESPAGGGTAVLAELPLASEAAGAIAR
jgi:PAS domain S-box-containing protein